MDSPAERLKAARAFRGVTQVELAKLSGVSQGSIGNVESGTRGFGRSGVALATALGVNAEWLVNGNGPMVKESYQATRVDQIDAAMQNLDAVLSVLTPGSRAMARDALKLYLDGQATEEEARAVLRACYSLAPKHETPAEERRSA